MKGWTGFSRYAGIEVVHPADARYKEAVQDCETRHREYLQHRAEPAGYLETMAGNVNLQVGFNFLMTEIDLGLTFAKIALEAAPHETDKIARNKQNVQTAYDTIVRYRQSVDLSPEHQRQFEAGFWRLRAALHHLNTRTDEL